MWDITEEQSHRISIVMFTLIFAAMVVSFVALTILRWWKTGQFPFFEISMLALFAGQFFLPNLRRRKSTKDA
jgi:uncharacterized membrane protein YesL